MALSDWFGRTRKDDGPWILVGLGAPGLQPLESREGIGRQMLLRAGVARGAMDAPSERLDLGTLYTVEPRLQALLPEVPPARTGEACLELLSRGVPARRVILVGPDLRLPFGMGRLRLSGAGGHAGVRSVMQALRTQRVPRLVFGTGILDRPKREFLRQRWPQDQWEALELLEPPFLRFLELLARAEGLTGVAREVNRIGFWRGVSALSGPPGP